MNKIAVYPGTFDPITLGHIDVIERASHLFDKVIVAIAANPKKNPTFTLEERVDMVTQVLRPMNNVSVIGFETLLTDFAKQQGAGVILRGLRMVIDFDLEYQLTGMYKQLAPEIESLFLMPSEKYSHISSTLVREVAALGGELKGFVPEFVANELKKKLRK